MDDDVCAGSEARTQMWKRFDDTLTRRQRESPEASGRWSVRVQCMPSTDGGGARLKNKRQMWLCPGPRTSFSRQSGARGETPVTRGRPGRATTDDLAPHLWGGTIRRHRVAVSASAVLIQFRGPPYAYRPTQVLSDHWPVATVAALWQRDFIETLAKPLNVTHADGIIRSSARRRPMQRASGPPIVDLMSVETSPTRSESRANHV